MIEVNEKTMLPIARIRTDGGTQPRAELNQEVIQDYAQKMHDNAVFPPIVVFYDGSNYWLADGFHRYHAARRIEQTTINAKVRQGTLRDAFLYSIEANTKHGLPLALPDRKCGAIKLLKDAEWGRWSDREIGRRCGLDHKTVGRLRQELTGEIPQLESRVYVSKHGTIATMNTANIGQQSLDPQQSVDEDSSSPAQQLYVKPHAYKLSRDQVFDAVDAGILEYEDEGDDNGVYRLSRDQVFDAIDAGILTEDDEEIEDDTYQWRYDPETHEAYCKYCYNTHRLWEVFDDVFPGDHVWECQVCEHRTKDEFMQIESRVVSVEKDEDEGTEDYTPEQPAPILPESNPPIEIHLDARKEQRDAHVMRVMGSSDSPEWYTPQLIIDVVVQMFGAIDTDPCSNSHESPTVPARTLYTKDDDGLAHTWTGKTYLNPPYGTEIGRWTNKLIDDYVHGHVTEGLALLPARIDTAWFQPLYSYPMCNVRGRIQFANSPYSAPFPCVVVYLGKREDVFIETFKNLGPIMRRIG